MMLTRFAGLIAVSICSASQINGFVRYVLCGLVCGCCFMYDLIKWANISVNI
jgi:hypothetical protein